MDRLTPALNVEKFSQDATQQQSSRSVKKSFPYLTSSSRKPRCFFDFLPCNDRCLLLLFSILLLEFCEGFDSGVIDKGDSSSNTRDEAGEALCSQIKDLCLLLSVCLQSVLLSVASLSLSPSDNFANASILCVFVFDESS